MDIFDIRYRYFGFIANIYLFDQYSDISIVDISAHHKDSKYPVAERHEQIKDLQRSCYLETTKISS